MDPIAPSAEPPAPPVDEAIEASTGFSLTPEQLTEAGLDGLQPGDTFSVTLTGTVTDNTAGVTADIQSASAGVKTSPTGEADPSAPPAKKPQSRVVGPDEAGFSDGGGY